MYKNIHLQFRPRKKEPITCTKNEIKRSSLGRPESTRMKVCRAQIAVPDNVA
jgi:hypothetical protein